jgi:lysophospholipase L1-like esterase
VTTGRKLPLPAIIGVVVVAALAIGGYVLFAGGDSNDNGGSVAGRNGSDDGSSGGTTIGGEADVRYLSMGDSLTEGIGADDADGAFPARLAERWRDAGCTVELLNAGISGYTAEQIISDQLPNVADFRPTIITFQTGGNDIANGVTERDYRRNVGTILDEAVDSGAEVIVLYQNEWERSPEGANYGGTRQLRETYNKILEDEAKSRDLKMTDLRSIYKKQADNKEWVDDGLHPTADAYDEWAEELFKRIPLPCDS